MGSEGTTGASDDEFAPLTPIRTPEAIASDEQCVTPKAAKHVLRAPVTCPPAPRKPRPAKRKAMGTTPPFFTAVPRDLTTVFLAIPQSEKRVRVS